MTGERMETVREAPRDGGLRGVSRERRERFNTIRRRPHGMTPITGIAISEWGGTRRSHLYTGRALHERATLCGRSVLGWETYELAKYAKTPEVDCKTCTKSLRNRCGEPCQSYPACPCDGEA